MEHRVKKYNAQFTNAVPPCAGISSLLGRQESKILSAIRRGVSLVWDPFNQIWDDVCKVADVKGKTPHSARHAMGRYIIEKTGNVAAVQRQLGHKNAAYSLQYARITDEELNVVLDGR
jgi:integrase